MQPGTLLYKVLSKGVLLGQVADLEQPRFSAHLVC